MSAIITQVVKELKSFADPVYKGGATNFFNEPINPYGTRTPIVRKIARTHWANVRSLPKKEIFLLCEELCERGHFEEVTIAFDWAWRLKKQYTSTDFSRFTRWLKKYVSNWAHCDDFCTHVIGHMLIEFPEHINTVLNWSTSKNRWLRRAAAISFIYPVRRKLYLDNIFSVSDMLLKDEDDLVQKGYGWALKEASNVFPGPVFSFVLERKADMPRTALRYAIEKYPKEMRKEAMRR